MADGEDKELIGEEDDEADDNNEEVDEEVEEDEDVDNPEDESENIEKTTVEDIAEVAKGDYTSGENGEGEEEDDENPEKEGEKQLVGEEDGGDMPDGEDEGVELMNSEDVVSMKREGEDERTEEIASAETTDEESEEIKSDRIIRQWPMFKVEPLPLTFSEVIAMGSRLPPAIVSPTGRILIWKIALGKAVKPDSYLCNYGSLKTSEFEIVTYHADKNAPRSLSRVYLLHENRFGTINTNTITFYPIIIVPNFFSSQTEWDTLSVLIATSTGQRILTVDTRNHGTSPFSTPDFGFPETLVDLNEFLEELNIGQNRSTLIGHGLAGWTILLFCLIYPHMIRTAIIIESKPFDNIKWLNQIYYLGELLDRIKVPPKKISLSSTKLKIGEYLKKYIKNIPLLVFVVNTLVVRKVLDKPDLWRERCTAVTHSLFSYVKFPPFARLLVFDKPILFISRRTIKMDELEIKKMFPSAVFGYVDSLNKNIHKEEKGKLLSLVISFLRIYPPPPTT